MSELSMVELAHDGEGVATIHLCDPSGTNALGEGLVGELQQRLAEVADDPRTRVCVLRGRSAVFSSGGSLDMLLDLAHGRTTSTDIPLLRAVLEFPVPTIAAVEGHAVGGGLVLALACDIVILARESRYGCPFIDMGFTPGMGTTRLLERAVGEYLAAEMMYGGELVRGSRLDGRASINRVVPRAQVLREAESLASRIAEKPRQVLQLLKRSLSLRKRLAFEEARTVESFMHDVCFAHPDAASRIEDGWLTRPGGSA